LIGRSPFRRSHVLAVGLLTAGFVCAGFFTHPSAALAATAAIAQSVRHAVVFESNGSITQHATDATTVGDFLHERNIVVGQNDYVYPALAVPLSDGLVITYRAAVAVTIQTARQRMSVLSSAPDVGALLEEAHVSLGANDEVKPSLSDAVPANGVVLIARVLTWERNEKRAIATTTIHRLDFSMTPGSTKVVAAGSQGERDLMVRFTQRDGGNIQRWVVASHVARKPQPRIVVDGVGEYEAFEHRGVERTMYVAQSALEMVATAYTAGCSGCSGITATGRPAGHGVVAVDPRVIPLGTRLFIPGYGIAVAGDTGGAIRGNRIDLGFNSLRDALLFGRRDVTVYRLK
jgi:3D (Asp-Asp-Asp) domain-containing protein